MSEQNDGGPAFPVVPYSTDAKNWSDGAEGMTLRDYAVIKFHAALLAQGCYIDEPERAVKHAKAHADAFLKAREK